MNFVKIIKSLQDADRKHEIIKKKFSSESKTNYVYKSCLREDEIEDLRIYGHTHADTISKFKRRFRASAHQTRSQKSLNLSYVQEDNTTTRVGKTHVRSKTAHRIPSRKTNKVLQIYDKNQEKQNNQIFRNFKRSGEILNNVQLTNNRENVIRNNMQIRKKSIIKFKKQFNSRFQEDLKTAKTVTAMKKYKQKTKTICFGSIYSKNMKETFPSEDANFFQLTHNAKQIKKKTLVIQQPNPQKQSQILRKLNLKIFDHFSRNYVANFTNCKKKNWMQYVYRLQLLEGKQNLKFIIFSLSSLTVYYFPFEVLNLLPNWLQQHLKLEKIIHLYIVKETANNEYDIQFQEFLVSASLAMQYLEWPKLIFRYYLRRFLLLANQSTKIQSVIQEEKIFYQNHHKVPSKFYRFIHELNEKPYSIITHKLNRNQGYLSQLLEEGFNQIEIRRLNWNPQKNLLTGLKKSNLLNHSKKQIYFCICSFLSTLQLLNSKLLIINFIIFQTNRTTFLYLLAIQCRFLMVIRQY